MFAAQRFEPGCGTGPQRRSMQAAGKAASELQVAYRRRCAGIVRAAGRRLPQKKINQTDLVFDMNPGHPLPAIAQPATQPQAKRWQQALQEAAITR
ncbi:hypothetical protein, partial [Salmonella enterica]|uniref:hypothetical protein n=1 Tax=Salmonella enterica TaxID=28901 RepID=UPI00398C6917